MSLTLEQFGVDRLSVEERLELLSLIWDSIDAQQDEPMITDAQRKELDRRLADHAANPEDVVPAEQVFSEALALIKQ